MAITHGRIALFVIGGVDISTRTTDGNLEQKRKTDTVEPCGNSPALKVVGVDDKSIKLKGVLDANVVAALQPHYDLADIVPYNLEFQGPNGTADAGVCIVAEFHKTATGSKVAEWNATLEVTTADQLIA